LTLLEIIEDTPSHKASFMAAIAKKMILRKCNVFRKSHGIKEDIDTHLSGVLSIIRSFRNESGHPSRKIISREQRCVLLNLNIPYCKTIYQLTRYFEV
jgi:hypothetical protein